MSFGKYIWENFFNSMLMVLFTIPLLNVIFSIVIQIFIRKKLLTLSILFLGQIVLYYGFSCFYCNMNIKDVYLDYVWIIGIYTFLFGLIGTFLGNFILHLKNKKAKK
ncbi:hypothetical protein HYH85_18665 [Clostridium botulinum]|uniref:hypothetical protein n=3 Tax=Clostridium botulinum TaxID=1491 RepID=UPI001C9B7931|nr:hypothetical protein [Clostridium botulinum]MBY6798224.1 hypothetical protein [Clostridium botulinum]